MDRLTIRELAEIVGGRLRLGSLPPLGGDQEPVGRIVADVRQVRSGDVFWRLAGDGADTGCAAEEAYVHGALGAVVAGRRLEPWAGKFSLEVEDTRWALWQLARWVRSRFTGRLIAVTGETGKSTAQHLIHSVLRRLRGGAPEGQLRSDAGLALNLLTLKSRDQFAALELPLSDEAPLDSLGHLCRPHVAVIAHPGACEPGGRARAAAAYEDLFAHLPADGWAVLNGDEPGLRPLAPVGRTVWVGRGPHCDLTATDIDAGHGPLTLRIEGRPVRTQLWGRRHVHAVLAAWAVGRLFDLPGPEIAAGIEQAEPLPQRCAVHTRSGWTVIDDTYNTTPTTALAALETFRDFAAAGRRILVCGELHTHDPDAAPAHRRLGAAAVTACRADRLVACGTHAADTADAARKAGMPASRITVLSGVGQAASALRQMAREGDVFLVLGGRGAHMEMAAAALGAPASSDSGPKEITYGSPAAPLNLLETPSAAAVLRDTNATLPPG